MEKNVKILNFTIFLGLKSKNNKKYFVCIDDKEDKKSGTFDEITLDENNKNIAYCKKGNQIYVYNTEAQELLLSTDADEIKYMYKNGDDYHGDFFFEIIKNGKYVFQFYD